MHETRKVCFLFFFQAIFGVETVSSGSEGNGLPTSVIGINGVMQCAATLEMPSTNIIAGNAIITVKESVYSFGGRLGNPAEHGSDAVYKYSFDTDTWTQMPSLNQKRYVMTASLLSENKIIISGTTIFSKGRGFKKNVKLFFMKVSCVDIHKD